MFTLILNLSLHKVISFTCHVLSIFKHAVWKTSLTMQYAKLTIYTPQIEVNFFKTKFKRVRIVQRTSFESANGMNRFKI